MFYTIRVLTIVALLFAVPSVAVTSTSSSGISSILRRAKTKTTSSATPSSTPLTCPSANGTKYTSGGHKYKIECGFDRYDNDLSTVYATTFNDCIAQCSPDSNCVDVSYRPGLPGNPGPCYKKNGLGRVTHDPAIWGARAVSSSRQFNLNCPYNNGSTFSLGSTIYQVICDTDYDDHNLASVPSYVSSIDGCIAVCWTTQGCQGVVLSGSACYTKYAVGEAISMPGLSAAICVSGCPSPISSSSSSATPTSTTN